MNRQTAETIITAYVKPVFGFALKRCRSVEDAEDLAQEIMLRAFRALLARDDIRDVEKFIWTIAHNTLANYYREHARQSIGVPLDEVAEWLADPDAALEDDDDREIILRLQREIAYLSKLQRKIVVAYYFDNRRQADIAAGLGIPLGTVKWHLFEAKKELKRGITMKRTASELKFNPIQFHAFGINGSTGKCSLDEIFRSTLVQNICYCVRDCAKTVAEIADALGVSPVYVEGEIEHLEEYGFLRQEHDRYIVNFLISEPTAELLTMQDTMYKRAAALFANELYDELTISGILDDPAIHCGIADRNFLLWSLIPYIAARSGEDMMDSHIAFEEVATIRPDGGQNIVHATVVPDALVLPDDYVYMDRWCGPMWNGKGDKLLWQIDSRWSNRLPPKERSIPEEAERVITYYHFARDHALSAFDRAWLAERGYVRPGTTDWQIVVLDGSDIHTRLLAIGERIKRRYKAEFDALAAPYIRASLDAVPTHLRRVKAYELQFLFHSDGWFLLHCLVGLLANGRLQEPAMEQRKALTTLLVV